MNTNGLIEGEGRGNGGDTHVCDDDPPLLEAPVHALGLSYASEINGVPCCVFKIQGRCTTKRGPKLYGGIIILFCTIPGAHKKWAPYHQSNQNPT